MSTRKKRTALTIGQKVEILNKLAADGNQLQLANEYGVTQSSVSKMKVNEAKSRNLWEAGQVKVMSSKIAKYEKDGEEGYGQAVTCLNCK